MNKENSIKLAYAAGFFDGEGCIRIVHRNGRNGKSDQYSLYVSIVQKDGKPIDWMYGNFGGMVYLKNKNGGDWIYEWRVMDTKAYEFLKKIEPFLIYKKEQVQIGIRFQERLKYGRKHTGGRYTSLTDAEQAQRKDMHDQMIEAKKRFTKSKNPNVVEYTFKSMVQP